MKSNHVYASWRLNIPNGPTAEGGNFYDAAYPVDPAGIELIKIAAAEHVTNLMRPMAMKQGHIMQPLSPQFVVIVCVIPAVSHIIN